MPFISLIANFIIFVARTEGAYRTFYKCYVQLCFVYFQLNGLAGWPVDINNDANSPANRDYLKRISEHIFVSIVRTLLQTADPMSKLRFTAASKFDFDIWLSTWVWICNSAFARKKGCMTILDSFLNITIIMSCLLLVH